MGKWARRLRALRLWRDPRRRQEEALKARLPPEFRRWLLEPVERYMPLERWGFRLTYTELRPAGASLIYDSPACRVKFNYVPGRFAWDYRIGIHYGRSHVPNDAGLLLEWQGELCYAWHNIGLHPYYAFLEGYSAEEAAEQYRTHSDRWPPWDQFREEIAPRMQEEHPELKRQGRQPAWAVAFEGWLWDYYGERLFSLFDMRRPERWEAFRAFLRRYLELVPDALRPYKGIPRWKVC